MTQYNAEVMLVVIRELSPLFMAAIFPALLFAYGIYRTIKGELDYQRWSKDGESESPLLLNEDVEVVWF